MASFKVTRRTLLGTLAGGIAAGSGSTAHAEEVWPSRMVRLTSPYGPGGSTSTAPRNGAGLPCRAIRQTTIQLFIPAT